MQFALTKIQPPRPRPGALVPRPGFEARLAQALLGSRLVLLVAGAGCGKTSALARQLAQLPAGTAVAWVACDADDSPAQLFDCLVAALEPFDPAWRSDPQALARAAAEAATPAQQRRVAAEWINALHGAAPPHGLIVLDDLHRVQQPALFGFFDALLEHFTPRWTLVLLSRRSPPMQVLARLRVMGELAEFGLDDLRLQPDEAQAMAAAAGLDAEAAARLYQRTQGWPAGLRLGLSAARGAGPLGRASSAIDRPVFDFLAAEVIDQLDAPLREFLLDVSVLPELTAERCAAVAGDAQAAERLDAIERAGLFVQRLDADETTLRLHDLFREALEARLERAGGERLARVLQAAAATERDTIARVHWLQRAGRWAEAEQALLADAERQAMQGRGGALAQAVARFPPAQREASGGLWLLQSQLAWGRWDWTTAIAATARAVAAFEAAGRPDDARRARAYHCVALQAGRHPEAPATIAAALADPALQGADRARVLCAAATGAARSDQRPVGRLLTSMLDALGEHPSPLRWYECCPVPPMVGLPGTRAPLQRFLLGLDRVLPEGTSPLRGMGHTIQGWLQLFAGDIAAAEASAQAGLDTARWLARPINVNSYSRGLQAVLQALRGDGAGAQATLAALIEEIEAGGDPLRTALYVGFYRHAALRCAALVDDRATVATLAAQLPTATGGDRSWLSAAQRSVVPAYAAWAAGDAAGAATAWQQVLDQADAADLYGQVVEARLRHADALLQAGHPPAEAAAALQPLWALAGLQAEGAPPAGAPAAAGATGDALAPEWAAVWMAGPACLQRLARAAWRDALGMPQRAVLQHWADSAAALLRPADGVAPGASALAQGVPAVPVGSAVPWLVPGADPAGPAGPAAMASAGSAAGPAVSLTAGNVAGSGSGALPGGLSQREWEVLARIAAGDSNKLIARAFALSPHTVKRHVANILDKLGLQSRGQAASWFHARRA